MSTRSRRARWAVTKRIKDVLKGLQTGHPELARHLTHTIKTGIVCGYLPDLDERVTWRL